MTNGLPTWAGSVDAEAPAQLLALGGERDWLDYKRQCDLSETRGVVEIVKDMGAMMVTGGYLIIGADDQGQPSRVGVLDVRHFPELRCRVRDICPLGQGMPGERSLLCRGPLRGGHGR
jgi:hypothetical protein